MCGIIEILANNLKSFKEDPNFYKKLPLYEKNKAKNDIYNYLNRNPRSWRDCAIWSIDMWNLSFRNPIIQLLHNFPEDSRTSEVCLV